MKDYCFSFIADIADNIAKKLPGRLQRYPADVMDKKWGEANVMNEMNSLIFQFHYAIYTMYLESLTTLYNYNIPFNKFKRKSHKIIIIGFL